MVRVNLAEPIQFAERPASEPAQPVPPAAALPMPAQALRGVGRNRAGALGRQVGTRWWRALLFLSTLLLTGALSHEMWRVLSVGELNVIELAMLVLFVVNIGWIAFGTCSCLIGLLRRSQPARPRATAGPLPGRTALLMPIYNEDPARVIGAAIAMLRALDAEAGGEDAAPFDVFLLSDTNRLPVWLAEQELVEAARADAGVGERLFYRHRLRNRARKAGNIGDWIERWGRAYDAFIVLDADSLMTPATMLELARRLEADPSAGIIQTSPRLINGETPLGRLQQFANRVYGTLNTRGLAAWFGDAGNYWGHNAIIRTGVFAASAGLPNLSGPPPFGGLILSHDFVEAALVRRAGYAVRMAEDLDGSYEQAPPNLIELASRDRRWCQGNLQHLRLLGTSGLHPLNRLHMLMGALSYLASPLWLFFLLAGMALALYAYIVPPNYFADRWSLFPTWPQIDSERAIALFVMCMVVLFLPKLLGLLLYLRDPASKGTRLLAIPSMVVESLFSALIAPVMMMTQSTAIMQILTGRDSGWNMQARGAARLGWRRLWRFHRSHIIAGAFLALAAGAISWQLLAWMSPALIGLCLSAPVAGFLAGPGAGRLMRWLGLFATPEERNPPAIAAAAEMEEARLLARAGAPCPDLAALLATPEAWGRHIAWLDRKTARRPGEADPALAGALLKIADGAAPEAFDEREAYGVAAAREILETLRDARAA
ncbi:MAG: glucans biosynthesis glucosyltransferase MdoH [Pikeienuella sp.]